MNFLECPDKTQLCISINFHKNSLNDVKIVISLMSLTVLYYYCNSNSQRFVERN